MPDRNFFLSPNASKARLREAENARKNRWDIIKSHSQGQVSRRDLIKMGLFTSAGMLIPISGLSPFARSAFADSTFRPDFRQVRCSECNHFLRRCHVSTCCRAIRFRF